MDDVHVLRICQLLWLVSKRGMATTDELTDLFVGDGLVLLSSCVRCVRDVSELVRVAPRAPATTLLVAS